ncbi:MAG TPA: acyl-CoA dehydrogenase [Dehalococcoidia bacterium]|nr:acyl-CoA dehydrogenase [Dehalococcoidia bacterium]
MEYFPWWNDAQRKLADEAKKVTDEILIPLGERCAWKREFPWEGLGEIAKRGWFGAQIPAKYGGRAEEWGVTGACIVLEETARAGEVATPLLDTMIGGIHQIIHDGTDEQKERWLPRVAKGELLGAITMTEPYAGSDIAGIETTATREGDYYIVDGKKRYQTAAAAADIYMTYVKTSDAPEDAAKYRHLTALIIEKGTPGFTIEKVNDLVGFDGMYNCYLNFNNAKVPIANRLGEEGAGWLVMMSGLNVERICCATGPLGWMREAIRYAVQHLQRRVQFRQLTGDIATNQFKVADMVWRLQLARLLTYYAAYCADLGKETPLESAIAKLFNTDSGLHTAIEAIQCMGGNGVTRFYPVERIMRDAKMAQIYAGTNEVMKLLIYRQGLRNLMPDLKVPPRVIDDELKIPMPLGKLQPRKAVSSEDDALIVLAENYQVNPGLHMSMEDIKELLDVSDEDLNKHLLSLEEKGLVGLYRDRRGAIALARATYKGLAQAKPLEYYRYIPAWVDKKDVF